VDGWVNAGVGRVHSRECATADCSNGAGACSRSWIVNASALLIDFMQIYQPMLTCSSTIPQLQLPIAISHPQLFGDMMNQKHWSARLDIPSQPKKRNKESGYGRNGHGSC
jgi:hypothetical protein